MIGKYVVILDMGPDKDYSRDAVKEELEKAGYKPIKVDFMGELADFYERGKDAGREN